MGKNYGMDSLMPFGKYRGTELEEILLDDPAYMKWLAEGEVIELDDEVLEHISRL